VEVVSPLVGQEARALAGLHLYHYGFSNCSQKVRIVLAEKGLEWTSHLVDIAAGENRSDHYRQINPNGVVPALVHDGATIIESSDIMEYLDVEFPPPPLRPGNAFELEQMHRWVARQESIQRPLEVLSKEFLAPVIANGHPARASQATIAGAVRVVEAALAEVNRHLGDRPWLVGHALSLADIAWVVDVHRFALMHFPMSGYPQLGSWYRRMRRLTSFRQAVLSYEPRDLRRRLHLYAIRRWLLRSHVGAAKWRSPRLLADA
jgi:glutathione S-transferase